MPKTNNVMHDGFAMTHVTDRAALAHLSWIVGPVLASFDLVGYPLTVVVQGTNAYAVVNSSTREYLACCPTLKLAKNHATWRAVAINMARSKRA